jgi:hypothetical protein
MEGTTIGEETQLDATNQQSESHPKRHYNHTKRSEKIGKHVIENVPSNVTCVLKGRLTSYSHERGGGRTMTEGSLVKEKVLLGCYVIFYSWLWTADFTKVKKFLREWLKEHNEDEKSFTPLTSRFDYYFDAST